MVDKNDLIITARLRENARETLTKMSRKTYIPVTTIHGRIKELEKTVIKRYVALLDFQKLGYNTRAIINLRVKKDFKDKIRDYLVVNKAVNSLYKINNGYDFLMEVVFREIGDVESFVENLENDFKIEKKEIYYIINEINKECFLSKYDYVRLTGSID